MEGKRRGGEEDFQAFPQFQICHYSTACKAGQLQRLPISILQVCSSGYSNMSANVTCKSDYINVGP